MEDLHDALLHRAVEVDQKIATRDEVQVRKGRVFNEIVMRKQYALAQLAAYTVPFLLLREEAAQAHGRNVHHVSSRVEALARRRDGLLVYVCGEDLQHRGAL